MLRLQKLFRHGLIGCENTSLLIYKLWDVCELEDHSVVSFASVP